MSPIKKYMNSKQVNTDNISNMQFKPGSKEPATRIFSPQKESKNGDEPNGISIQPESMVNSELNYQSYHPQETNEILNSF